MCDTPQDFQSMFGHFTTLSMKGLNTTSIGAFLSILLIETDLVECDVKIAISLPASCSINFMHLLIVSLEACRYGFDVVINKHTSYIIPE